MQEEAVATRRRAQQGDIVFQVQVRPLRSATRLADGSESNSGLSSPRLADSGGPLPVRFVAPPTVAFEVPLGDGATGPDYAAPTSASTWRRAADEAQGETSGGRTAPMASSWRADGRSVDDEQVGGQARVGNTFSALLSSVEWKERVGPWVFTDALHCAPGLLAPRCCSPSLT